MTCIEVPWPDGYDELKIAQLKARDMVWGWLMDRGYHITKTFDHEKCTACQCERRGKRHVMYMFAWEQKKYVLPIEDEIAEDEVLNYHSYVFSDGIWRSGRIVESIPDKYGVYPDRGQGIAFKNGFFLSAYLCYEKSTPL